MQSRQPRRAMMGCGDDGFAIVESAVADSELAPVLRAICSVPSRSRAGARHLLHIPAVRRLAEDRRLLQIAARFLGPSPTPFKATLFEKSGDANWQVAWHQDIALPVVSKVDAAGWGPWSIKAGVAYAQAPAAALARIVAVRVHFDNSTAENGPLRILPGSHAFGRLSDEQISILVQQVAPVECTVSAGGVVAMRPLLVHASSKSRCAAPRRVLHIEYAGPDPLGAGIELAVA